MATLDFYYDTQKVTEDITNWRDLEIEVNFDDETGAGTVKSGSLEFVGQLADKINNWVAAGMNGGPGIFEAPPFRIEACGGDVIFDGGINTAACETLYECDKVVAPLRTQTIDFINDRASSFSLAYLASLPANSPGRITQADYISVPYVINTIPDYVNIMVAGISLYMLIKELQEIIRSTVDVINELSGDVVMALGSIVNPIIATAIAIGRVLVDIIRITFYILYLVFMIKAIIDLVIMIFDNLIQPVKYKKGMKVVTMFQRCCTYLGFNFSSTLLTLTNHSSDVVVPEKEALVNNATTVQGIFGLQNISRKDYDDNNNPSSVGYSKNWTFADLILREEARLNAEVRIIGNTLYFETKDFFAHISSYILPDIKMDPHSTNACELASNYLLSYSLDAQDTNTYDRYEGTSCQMQLSPNTVLNTKNILLKNLTDITLQYALAKRKTSLNSVEEIVSTLYNIAATIYNAITGFFNAILTVINNVMNAISNLVGGNTPTIPLIAAFPPNPIAARIGMMLLSSDFIGVPKILVIDSTGKLHSNNTGFTSARTLIDELHFTNFAIRKITTSGQPKNDHNQWLIYTDKTIPFCCDDYRQILNNNYCKTHDGRQAKIRSLIWKPEENTARVTYRVKDQYTSNLNQTYIIDGKP